MLRGRVGAEFVTLMEEEYEALVQHFPNHKLIINENAKQPKTSEDGVKVLVDKSRLSDSSYLDELLKEQEEVTDVQLHISM